VIRACREVDFGGPSAFWKKLRRVFVCFFEDCGLAPEEGFEGVDVLRVAPAISRRVIME
jgi:hypothetical protein